jgi:hypothetical protein
VALAALLVMAAPVGAGKKWCRADPVVNIDGYPIQILVGVEEQYVSAVNGPIAVEIGTPAGVQRNLISTDPGFNGFGEVVIFKDIPNGKGKKGMPVKLRVTLPVNAKKVKKLSNVQIQVIITQDHTREVIVMGNAQKGVSASFYLKDVLAIQE